MHSNGETYCAEVFLDKRGKPGRLAPSEEKQIQDLGQLQASFSAGPKQVYINVMHPASPAFAWRLAHKLQQHLLSAESAPGNEQHCPL